MNNESMFKEKLNIIWRFAKKPRSILGLLSFFVILLRVIPTSFSDIYSDNALNSFRAYGWFDWIGSGVQTTPFSWLGHVTWWSQLSFHDAPPLAFLVQNIFFNLFGNSVFVLRLPFVLAGIGSVFLVFFLLKRVTNFHTASIAAILYSFVSYGVWAGHAAYLEGIEEFFIVGSLLFGAIYLFKGQNHKYLYLWSAFTAAALMTKYTSVFLLPPMVIYLFLYRNTLRPHLKNIVISAVLFVTLLSPVIIYNVKTYQLRGHFDAALSSMVGIDSGDFGQLRGRELTLSKSGFSFSGLAQTFGENISWPLLALIVFCIGASLWKLRKDGLRNVESWVLVNLFFLFILFAVGASGTRFVSISVPLLVMLVSFGMIFVIEHVKDSKLRYSFIALAAVIFVFEFLYSFNTNFLNTPWGSPRWFYSENRLKNVGFNQLDSYMREKALVDLPAKVSIQKVSDIGFRGEDVRGRSAVIYDDRINWFSQMWYLQKYFFFYRLPVISTTSFIPGRVEYIDVEKLLQASGKEMYFIFPLNQDVMDPVRADDELLNVMGPSISEQLEKDSVPADIIKDEAGVPAFKVYIIPAVR
jgi:4-amino-4-deoxy-L-arabinose transferase-like glycosyltransferase